jgi:hypothetical protein
MTRYPSPRTCPHPMNLFIYWEPPTICFNYQCATSWNIHVIFLISTNFRYVNISTFFLHIWSLSIWKFECMKSSFCPTFCLQVAISRVLASFWRYPYLDQSYVNISTFFLHIWSFITYYSLQFLSNGDTK